MKNNARKNSLLKIIGLSLVLSVSALYSQNFLDTFEDGTTNGWEMGPSQSASNIATGGPDGVDDNYMQLAPDGSGDSGKLIVLNQTQWGGNFTSLGVTAISFNVNNLNASSNIDLRIALKIDGGITNDVNAWCATTNSVHLDASVGWQTVSIPIEVGDLTDLGDGTVTVSQILANVGQVRILDASSLPAHRGDPSTDLLGLDNITDGTLLAPNGAPVLNWTSEAGYTTDGVNPDQGTNNDTFTFRVNYSDADGDAPASGYPRVKIFKNASEISGSPFPMTIFGGGTFETGRIYTVNVNSLIPGNDYTYQFEAQDSNSNSASGDPTSLSNGPLVNQANRAPLLSWTSEPGYESNGVNPDTATTDDPFIFRVLYSDADGDAPASGYPRVRIYKDATEIGSSPFQMSVFGGGTYTIGRIYTVNVSGLEEGNDYTYRFEANDANDVEATGDPVGLLNGPTINSGNSPPTLSWTGETGYESDGVDPDQGSADDLYTFRVLYSDNDENPPDAGYPRLNILKNGLAITGSPFSMNQANSNPFNTGRIYSVIVNGLVSGNDYTYYFEAVDINGANSTGDPNNSQNGPLVTADPSQFTFTEFQIISQNLYNGDMAWGDYDNDGDLDLAIAAFEDGMGAINSIYRNDGGENFTLIYNITGSVGNTVWGDYDNDGDLDLLLGGILFNNNNNTLEGTDEFTGTFAQTNFVDYDNDGDLDVHTSYDINSAGGLYENVGGTFTYDAERSSDLIDGDFASWGDYDNDGDKDLIVIANSGSYESILYRNDDSTFVDWEFDFDATSYGQSFGYPNNGFRFASIDWGDYDNDGDLDFVIIGEAREEDAGTTGRVSIMYRNDGEHPINLGEWLFTQTEEERYWPSRMYQGVHRGTADWADFNNDGLRDFLYSGSIGTSTNANNYITRMYINNGTDIFELNTTTQNSIRGMGLSSLAVGDYDNDGDLDYMQNGYSGTTGGVGYASRLYKNNISNSFIDNPPSAPLNLRHEFLEGEIILMWDVAADDFTSPEGLTYNVRVGTHPDSQNIVASHSFPDGRLKMPFKGNAESARILKLSDLDLGTNFFWSVQAIDAGYKSSPFAPVAPFNTFAPLITMGSVPDTLISGESFEISWTSNNVQNINIEYLDNFGNRVNIAETYPADSGRYEWTVPEITGTGYTLLLSNVDNLGLNSTSESFSIVERYIVIIEPDGGEFFNIGDTAYVSWFSPYESDFRLEYSTNGGNAWSLITDIEETFSSSTEEWIIPASPSTECLIRVTDLNHPAVSIVSDSYFTILEAPVIIIGSVPPILIPEQVLSIQWTATNVDSVKIEYLDDIGNPFSIIESIAANLNEYIWMVPEVSGSGYTIRISDVSDTSVSATSNVFSIAQDVTGPQFTEVDLDPEVIIYDQTQSDSVSVKIWDDSDINDATVTLYYKEAGAASYSFTSMNFEDESEDLREYSAEIMFNSRTEKGIQLYATAEDIHGNLGTSALNFIGVQIPAVANPDPPRSGFDLEDYSLFSIPLVLDNPSITNFLDINSDLGSNYNAEAYRLYAYQNGTTDGFVEYTDSPGFPNLVPGKGFFIITNKDISMSTGPGSAVDASTNFIISGLQPGWNLIGHPFNFPVSFDSVYAYSNTSNQIVTFDLWEYNGVQGWQAVTSGNLEPWKGYALNLHSNDNDQIFVVPPVPAGLSKSLFTTTNNSSEEWMIQIEASNGNSKSTFNFAGQLNNASDGLDKYDLNAPPVIGNRVTISFDNENEEQRVTDIRENNYQGHVWDFSSKTKSNDRILKLDFKGLDKIDIEYEIFLLSKDKNVSFNLRKQNPVEFITSSETTKQFKLIVGSKEYLETLDIVGDLYPEKFDLYNNFPNPFNPQTQITFDLSQNENIELGVYDALGQQVDILKKGFLEAGSYNVVWNAQDKSSGIYFIRLVAGKNVKTIRALLLK